LLKNWKQYEELAHGSNWNLVNYLCSNYVVRNWKGDCMMKSYDSWLESGVDQGSLQDQQEYVWTTYMKQGKPCDPMDLDNFQEYLADATADYKGAEKWENLRQYADRGEWEKFGRAIYFLVHDHIEDKLIAEEE
jgi:hypothetical protein